MAAAAAACRHHGQREPQFPGTYPRERSCLQSLYLGFLTRGKTSAGVVYCLLLAPQTAATTELHSEASTKDGTIQSSWRLLTLPCDGMEYLKRIGTTNVVVVDSIVPRKEKTMERLEAEVGSSQC